MAKPELYHFKAARRLLLYLRDTKEKGIRYSQKEMHRFKSSRIVTATTDESMMDGKKEIFDQYLEAAVDASFADCCKTYRSTSGFVVWFGGSPIEWECKRQPLVTLSTMESEYVAASKCVCSIRFIHKLLNFLDLHRQGPTKCHEDNSACVAISTKPVHKSRSKHIGVKYHNVREASLNGEVELCQVWTEHQVGDIFTKSLSKADFIRCRETLMGYISFDEMVRQHPNPKSKVTQKLNIKYSPISVCLVMHTKVLPLRRSSVGQHLPYHKRSIGRDEHLDAFLGKTASWVKQDLTAQATAQRLLLAK